MRKKCKKNAKNMKGREKNAKMKGEKKCNAMQHNTTHKLVS
jgi:hypothetical protein